MAEPDRAAFDRYPKVRIPFKVAIYARSPSINFMKMTTFVVCCDMQRTMQELP